MGVLSLFLDKAEQGRDWPLFIKSGFKGTLPSELDTHSLFLLANAVTASDPNTALKLYSYSADKGCIPALLKLGAWYELGLEDVPDIIPVKRNAQISLYYHTRAALAGSIEAAYFLMAAHCQGSHGLEKSYAKALEWAAARLFGIETLEETMPSVYTLAHWQAGLMWMEGSFGLDDPQPAKAADHWTRSGLKGHGPSLWNLGVFALNGFGIDQDIEQGIKNIKKGMELDETLRMPPQLEGLSEEELDVMALIAKEAISEAVAERANQEQSEPIVVNVVSLVKAAKKAVQDSRDGILPNVVTEGAVADEAHKPSRKTTAEPKEKRKKKQKASLGVSETSSPAWYKNPTVAMVLLPLAVIGIAVIARRAISSA